MTAQFGYDRHETQSYVGNTGLMGIDPNSVDVERQASIDKIVVFTGTLNFSVRTGIRAILDSFDDVTVDVLLYRPRRKASRLVRNQFRNLKKHGISWIPYQAWDIGSRLFFSQEPYSKLELPMPGLRYTLENLTSSDRVRITVLPSVNGEAAQRLIKELSPDLGVSLAAPILNERIFTVPRLGTINLHKGKLPDYRGMPPAFWEIWEGQSSVGCTVHKVEATLDTGPIVIETELPIEDYSTPDGIRFRLDAEGNRLIVEAIRKIRDGADYLRAQIGEGRTNTRPPLPLERKLRRELAAREGTVGSVQQVKDILFTGYSCIMAAGRRLRPLPSRQSVVVFLYHRVNDALRDNVTIGIERFDRHMAYLKRHWPVVPLRTVIRGEVDYCGRKPLVCVTFDDGYRDNYDYAAPILSKHRLPATFFVSTDKLTNQTPFEHDLEKLGKGLPNMSWDQAREMRRDGLDFGSHTVNHANLARITLDEAKVELVESRETLRKELGQEEFLFAYPFGKRSDISPEARDLVRESGYVCCCSAYGGINAEPLNVFNILRIGVNYNFSLPALRSRLNAWG